eukprot:gene6691-3745_t
MEAPLGGDSSDISRDSAGQRLYAQLGNRGQKFLDDVNPHKVPRWIFFFLTLVVYLVRTYLLQGWYIVTYALGIYLLNLLIAFLSPKIDPATLDEDTGDEGEEFKPFIRRLPEFKFWFGAQRAVCMSIAATFFQAFNVPVFWPILVLYFFVLFGISMKQRIKHMIKYKYTPFDMGKTKHKGKADSGAVVST